MAKTKRKTKITVSDREVRDMEKLYRKERRAPARWTKLEMEKIEHALNDPTNHVWRRVAFGVQAMPGKELFAKIRGDRDSAVLFAEAAEEIGKYVAAHREMVEFVSAARMRRTPTRR
jgi:hypothetical protein